MSHRQRDAVNTMMGQAPLDVGGVVVEQRAIFERMLGSEPLPDDVMVSEGELGGVPTATIEIEGATTDRTLLHFHGGWYTMGSPRTAARLTSDIARRTGARVISVDYRLAPEHPYPAALDDALAAYSSLLDSGVAPEELVVVGESAGGGIALSTLVAAVGEGLAQPAAGVLLSPWTNLTLSGESMTAKVGIDPAFRPEAVRVRAADYVGAADPADPRISPLFAELGAIAPLLIQAGSYEILLDDSTRLAGRAAAADVPVILDVTPGVPHLFQGFAAVLEEGDAALDRVARFITEAVR